MEQTQAIQKTGFLQESPGNNSSSRLHQTIALVSAVVIALAYAGAGVYRYCSQIEHESLATMALAIGTIYTMTIAPIAYWHIQQKKIEK